MIDPYDEDEYFPYVDEVLAWQNYPAYDEIVTDKTSTLFITLDNDEISQDAFAQLQKWALKKYPRSKLFKDKYENESFKIKNKSDIALCFYVDNCLTVRFLKPDLKKELLEYLEDTYMVESESFVEINHKEEKSLIRNSKLKVLSRTGITKYNKDWIPYSFWNIYKGEKLVSKVLIGFHALEMCDCAPTILMFEVLPKFRRKGFGEKIVRGIEYYMYEQGFSKLRLENTKAISFWRKLNYEIDIDEGEKYLDYLEFENS